MKIGFRQGVLSTLSSTISSIFSSSALLALFGLTSFLILSGCVHSPQFEPLRWSSHRAVPSLAAGYQTSFVRLNNGNVFFAWPAGEEADARAQWILRDGHEWPTMTLAPYGSAAYRFLAVSANTAGDSVVAWTRSEEDQEQVMGVRLHHRLGMVRFDTPPVQGFIRGMTTATDEHGNSLVVWVTENNQFRSLYCPAEGECVLNKEFLLEIEPKIKAHIEEIGLVSLDNGFVLVWNREDRANIHSYQLYSNVFRNGIFEASTLITNNGTDAHVRLSKLVQKTPDGAAIAWGDGYGSIYVRRFRSTKDWLPAEIVCDGSRNILDLQLQADADGILHTLWGEVKDLRSAVWSNRGELDGTWGSAIRIDTTDLPHFANGAKLLVHKDGRVASIWYQISDYGKRNELWGNATLANGRWGVAQKLPLPEIEDATHNYLTKVRYAEGNTVWLDIDEESWIYWLD